MLPITSLAFGCFIFSSNNSSNVAGLIQVTRSPLMYRLFGLAASGSLQSTQLSNILQFKLFPYDNSHALPPPHLLPLQAIAISPEVTLSLREFRLCALDSLLVAAKPHFWLENRCTDVAAHRDHVRFLWLVVGQFWIFACGLARMYFKNEWEKLNSLLLRALSLPPSKGRERALGMRLQL